MRLRALAELCGEGDVSAHATTRSVAPRRGQAGLVMSLAVAPGGGDLLASASWDKTVRLWRLPDGECVATLRGHRAWVLSSAVTPDGSLLASGSWDDTIRLWRLPDGGCVATLRGRGTASAHWPITADGSFLASGSWTEQCVCGACRAARAWPRSGGTRVGSGALDLHPGWQPARQWECRWRPSACGACLGECVATLLGHESAAWTPSLAPERRPVRERELRWDPPPVGLRIDRVAATPVAATCPRPRVASSRCVGDVLSSARARLA